MSASQYLPCSEQSGVRENVFPNESSFVGRRAASIGASEGLPQASRSPRYSAAGFLLIDSSLRPISFNSEAVQILSYPDKLAKPARSDVFNRKIRAALLRKESPIDRPFVSEFKSGRRRYFCRVFEVETGGRQSPDVALAVLLERGPSRLMPLAQVARQYHFTQREAEALKYLLQGLSSKEIADRMNVSTNTVKTFLRLIMIKTGVSSRSAMIGKIMMTQM